MALPELDVSADVDAKSRPAARGIAIDWIHHTARATTKTTTTPHMESTNSRARATPRRRDVTAMRLQTAADRIGWRHHEAPTRRPAVRSAPRRLTHSARVRSGDRDTRARSDRQWTPDGVVRHVRRFAEFVVAAYVIAYAEIVGLVLLLSAFAELTRAALLIGSLALLAAALGVKLLTGGELAPTLAFPASPGPPWIRAQCWY